MMIVSSTLNFVQIKCCYSPCLDIQNAKITPHNVNETVSALIRDGRSTIDLDSSSVNSVRRSIPLLESEVLLRNQEVTHLKTLLSTLQRELDNAQRDLDHHKSILAPIRLLPDDLLLRIFKFASHGTDDQLSHPSHSRWALLRVCHSWRVIALNNPTLWSVLAFNFIDWDICSPHNRTLFSRALDLSKNSSLSIQLNLDFLETDDDDFLWDCIAPTSFRWVTCDLSSYACYFQQFLYLFGKVPRLHTLRLEAGGGLRLLSMVWRFRTGALPNSSLLQLHCAPLNFTDRNSNGYLFPFISSPNSQYTTRPKRAPRLFFMSASLPQPTSRLFLSTAKMR